jgi:hypothetical protein
MESMTKEDFIKGTLDKWAEKLEGADVSQTDVTNLMEMLRDHVKENDFQDLENQMINFTGLDV